MKLKGVPRAAFGYQQRLKTLVTWAESDFAGCEQSKKSTSPGVVVFGNHFVKSWSTNQAAIALSSGEAEYYGLVKVGSISLGLKAIAFKLVIEFEVPIEISSDASAAIGISNRIGSGKVRHVEVTQLLLQDKGSKKVI